MEIKICGLVYSLDEKREYSRNFLRKIKKLEKILNYGLIDTSRWSEIFHSEDFCSLLTDIQHANIQI